MLKPPTFQQRFLALRNIPYQCGLPEEQGNVNGGVLGQGKAVWIEFEGVPDRGIELHVAFVEDLGIISLNPNWLIPANIVKEE